MTDKPSRKGYLLAVMVVAAALAAGYAYAQTQQPQAHLPPPLATPSAKVFPKVIGWQAGTMPRAPDGFMVEPFADLESPRWIYVLPNNDVLVSQASTTKAPKVDPETVRAMKEARNIGPSP